ncbi:MAG TPA: DUF1175 family protein [Candidatus Nitrosotenuis sp.]|nr:DUF1175 family protein [Candidatus Nitrosotenuis sp.]
MTAPRIVLAACLLGAFVIAVSYFVAAANDELQVELSGDSSLVADGRSTVKLLVSRSGGRALAWRDIAIEFPGKARRLRLESARNVESGKVLIALRTGVLPGPAAVALKSEKPRRIVARMDIPLQPVFSDRYEDGTPDFLRLDTEADRETFRRWFVLLAEAAYLNPPQLLPKEINDCAALVRFAYREALRDKSAEWNPAPGLNVLRSAPQIEKYSYPFTPLGAGLFRVRAGTFAPSDLRDGTFAEFADAQTLLRWNAHLVTRDAASALPGDLLFFRQLEQNLPYHVMIFVGSSEPQRAEAGPPHAAEGAFIVYHTGPIGRSAGEMRRASLQELFHHPSPRWRPVPGNSNFLGVYRWNILREGK